MNTRDRQEGPEKPEKQEKKSKRSILWLAIAILALAGIISYAASMLFYSSNPQRSNYTFSHIFQFDVNEFFTEGGSFTPGNSKNINPIVTSDATIDSYVVIVVEMPKHNRNGLYTIENSNGLGSLNDWSKIDSWEQGDSWFEAYMYNDVLAAGAATKPLGNKITMVSMRNAEYGKYVGTDNLNITMTAYACGIDGGESMESAWSTIKGHFNLGD